MSIANHMIGQKVIIRSNGSGVHHGTLLAVDGSTVRLENSRRLWEWNTDGHGISLSEVAITGISQQKSKITEVLPDLIVFDVCEIIPTHGLADVTIEGARTFKP